MVIVLRIGGSIVASPTNPRLIGKYVELLQDLGTKGHKVIVVVGGGALARQFIRVGGELGLTEDAQDWLAIEVSRLYALLFTLKLDADGRENISTSIDEALKTLKKRNIVVLGGLKPGMTTDTVAALIAQKIKAQLLVKATDQEGIYTKDPKKYPDAKKLD
ncbi:UMP kinase, partial [Candidatus Bathyarchaeota archaeon]|nr:UMP kinase [Candidatus Bathyarchaeota archaeon]